MVASITSGPMPSPGTRRSLYSFIGVSSLFGLVAPALAYAPTVTWYQQQLVLVHGILFTLCWLLRLSPSLLNPGLLDVLLLLEGRDLVFGAHGQTDIVPAIEQALLTEVIDL